MIASRSAPQKWIASQAGRHRSSCELKEDYHPTDAVLTRSEKNSLVKSLVNVTAALVAVLICSSAVRGSDGHWNTFKSRSGWTVAYPGSWETASCHSCSDPRAAGMYVDFFPPEDRAGDGWVMISPLEDKPANTSVDRWLVEIADSANQNPHIREKRFSSGGKPAFEVQYRASDGAFMDDVYVISGRRTFSIAFSGGRDGVAVEKFGNYPVFCRMVESFTIKPAGLSTMRFALRSR